MSDRSRDNSRIRTSVRTKLTILIYHQSLSPSDSPAEHEPSPTWSSRTRAKPYFLVPYKSQAAPSPCCVTARPHIHPSAYVTYHPLCGRAWRRPCRTRRPGRTLSTSSATGPGPLCGRGRCCSRRADRWASAFYRPEAHRPAAAPPRASALADCRRGCPPRRRSSSGLGYVTRCDLDTPAGSSPPFLAHSHSPLPSPPVRRTIARLLRFSYRRRSESFGRLLRQEVQAQLFGPHRVASLKAL